MFSRLTVFVCWCAMSPLAAQDDFFTAAAERIEQHRKQDAVVHLRARDGSPLPGARIRVVQRDHAFVFGTQVNARFWEECGDEHPYRRAIIAGDFNTAVLGNALKWTSWERMQRRERAVRAIDWFERHGLRVRGHTMVWGTDNWGVSGPMDIRALVERAEGEDVAGYRWRGEPQPAVVRARIDGHIRSLGSFFRGRIHDWDVLNEPTSENWWTVLLDPEADPRRSQLMVDWFRAARAGAGPGARLAINDFHILVGDHRQHRDDYAAVITYLQEHGAPLDAIGFQGHFYHSNLRRSPAQLYAVLERFGRFGLPMFVSEFDCSGKGWGENRDAAEKARAQFLREILITCFSHPQVDGFVIWGYWDGSHWLGNAPFYRADWSAKPGLAVWRELVRDRWWTEVAGTTDAEGRFAFRGFKGRYEVVVVNEAEEEILVAPVRLGDAPAVFHLAAR
ncbi:MAG: endo-1,4-beta-xylanase [Planctomycetota bacterium]